MDIACFISITVFGLAAWVSDAHALRCYECKYLESRTDNFIVSTVLSGVESQPACQQIDGGQDADNDIASCGEPEEGFVVKCVAIKGDMSTVVDVPFVGLTDVDLYAVLRGCIQVPENHDNGCHDDLSPATIEYIKGEVEEEIPDIELGEIEFSGNACYADELLTDTTFSGSEDTMNPFSVSTTSMTTYSAVVTEETSNGSGVLMSAYSVMMGVALLSVILMYTNVNF